MSLNERIREIIKFLKINDGDFAKSIRYSNMNLSNVLTGNTKNPKADLLINIVKEYPNLNPKWLLLGQGQMWLADEKVEIGKKEKGDDIKQFEERLNKNEVWMKAMDNKLDEILESFDKEQGI